MTRKSKPYICASLVFALICAASAFIGWCTGFNFDHRNTDVAMWVFATIGLGTAIFCAVMGDISSGR